MKERNYEALDCTQVASVDANVAFGELRLARLEDGSFRLDGGACSYGLDRGTAELLYAQLGEALGKAAYIPWKLEPYTLNPNAPGYPYAVWCQESSKKGQPK